MKNVFLLVSLGFFVQSISAQTKYEASKVIDPRYGITMYNDLVKLAGGDSVRMCEGIPCGGYVEDYYTGGQLLHKGYYVEGQIKIYKNYYPEGTMERKFVVLDDHKSRLKTFYKSEAPRSEILYVDGDVREWRDYYENGNIEFEEKYVKGQSHAVYRRFFYEDGKPQDIMEFEKKRKRLYKKTEYFTNGQIKLQGNVVYSDQLMDYAKSGDWMEYNEEGKLIKKTSYIMGQSTNVERY